jgi:hypothetical protein
MEELVFAVVKDGIVKNAVVGEALAIVQALLPDDDVVQITSETGHAVIGGAFSNGKFFPPKPFPSWVSDGEGGWEPPVAEPTLAPGLYSEWNEEKINWDILEIPAE